MATEIVMPRLGWTMEEGIFGEWLKADGEEVKSGDLLFTVESDKATQEVESFENGILRIPPDGPKTGDVIPVGGRMGFIVKPGEAAPFETDGAKAAASAPTADSAPEAPAKASLALGSAAPSSASASTRKRGDSFPTISPRARRVAAELGIDWAQLTGSGRTGRIVERDVRAAHAQRTATPTAAPTVKTPAPAVVHRGRPRGPGSGPMTAALVAVPGPAGRARGGRAAVRRRPGGAGRDRRCRRRRSRVRRGRSTAPASGTRVPVRVFATPPCGTR